jgi:restriction endonuclease Mrr
MVQPGDKHDVRIMNSNIASAGTDTGHRSSIDTGVAVPRAPVAKAIRADMEMMRAITRNPIAEAMQADIERMRLITRNPIAEAMREDLERVRALTRNPVSEAMRENLERVRALTRNPIAETMQAELERWRALTRNPVAEAMQAELERVREMTRNPLAEMMKESRRWQAALDPQSFSNLLASLEAEEPPEELPTDDAPSNQNEASADDATKERIANLLAPQNDALIRELARRPEDMHLLSPRQFEFLIAEILRDLGWNVELTPVSKDRGRDIIASGTLGGFPVLALVECKKYRPAKKVGIEVVKQFLYTIREQDKASIGIIATSSAFTQGAQEKARHHKWQLHLSDFHQLAELLRSYGQFKKHPGAGLWTKENDSGVRHV